MAELSLQSFFPPRREERGGTESSNCLIKELVPLATSLRSKSYLFNINSGLVERGSSHPYYSENSKSFRNSMPGTGGKNQLYILHFMSQFLSYFLVEVHSFYFYFRFVILLELVFTYGMRYESRFIYLHTDTPLFQQHLLKRLALFL